MVIRATRPSLAVPRHSEALDAPRWRADDGDDPRVKAIKEIRIKEYAECVSRREPIRYVPVSREELR